MSIHVAKLTRTVCLSGATAIAILSILPSCSSPSGSGSSGGYRGSNYRYSSILTPRSRALPHRHATPGVTPAPAPPPSRTAPAPVTASPSPQRVATSRRSFRPGSLFAWIFRTDPNERTTRSRTRSRRESREQQRSEPQRPAVPSTIVNQGVLAKSNRSNTRVIVDVAQQKAYLLVNESVAIEAPVSTARAGKSTPRGTFRMGQRVRSGKISTIYGVAMPYWMRLGGSVYGVHAGYLPGYPASAGCIRLPSDAARLIYDNTTSGTRVSIYSSWDRS